MLEEHHCFPGPYTFKVIGFGHDEFAAEVRAAAEGVVGPLTDRFAVRTRPSSGGKYHAVTLEVEAGGADQVLGIYEALRAVEGVVMLV